MSEKGNQQSAMPMSRRQFVKMGGLAVLAMAWALPRFAASSEDDEEVPLERSLWFYNTHTKETLKTVYWIDGQYMPSALESINYILRDHRTNEIMPIDTDLLDLLHEISEKVEAREPFHIISGYRSPESNKLLRKNGNGVAKKSLHLQGKAVDIRLPGCSLPLLRETAMELKAGGVGYYPRSNFIHVDVGRVRYW